MYVEKFTEAQVAKVESKLRGQGWDFDTPQYTHWRARQNKTTATAYLSGKFVLQGKATAELVEFFIEPEVTQTVGFGYEKELATESDDSLDLEQFGPHCGIDESGKGDFFGPLVVSCVYTDEETAKKLIDAGVQDSKAIKSDTKIHALAEKIRRIVKGKYSILAMGPEAYNRFYLKSKNLNKMLAWGHAKSLETVLEKVPDCPRALSDQFAKNKNVVLSALLERGKKIQVDQRTKAESDVAVAAASILARAEFVSRMDKLSVEAGMTLPKGASAKVIQVAVELVKKKGADELGNFSKTHFKTTETVLSRARNY